MFSCGQAKDYDEDIKQVQEQTTRDIIMPNAIGATMTRSRPKSLCEGFNKAVESFLIEMELKDTTWKLTKLKISREPPIGAD